MRIEFLSILYVVFTNTSIGEKLRQQFSVEETDYDDFYVENLYNKADGVDFVISYHGEETTYTTSMTVVDSVTVNPETGEEVPVKYPTTVLTCDNPNITIAAADETNVTQVATIADDAIYSVSVSGYIVDATYDEAGNLTAEAYQGVRVLAAGKSYSFDITDEGYKFRNFRGLDVDFPSDTEYWRVFKDSFWHGRGYLYNYTLPLLKNYILLGAGSNTFIRVYPQNDYLFETYHSIDVKPHCFYLQQWTENGLVALIAVLVFLIWMVIELLKLLIIETDDAAWQRGGVWRTLSLASLAGVLGTAVSWLANDSNICTSPAVWAAFGVALVCIKKGRGVSGKAGNA